MLYARWYLGDGGISFIVCLYPKLSSMICAGPCCISICGPSGRSLLFHIVAKTTTI